MDVLLDDEVIVMLSVRNLYDLVKQVEQRDNPYLSPDDPGEPYAQLVRSCPQRDGGRVFLRVVVEADAVHYDGRTPGPGVHGGEE